MKLVVIFCLIAAVVAAPPLYQPYNAALLNYYYDNPGTGTYQYGYEQDDGTKAEQTGQLKNAGTDNEILGVSGSYEWISPEGRKYTVTYTADEDGYQPQVEEGPGPGLGGNTVASLLG